MSASSELLVEHILNIENEISEKSKQGENVIALKVQRQQLIEQLNAANKALNENKEILKG